jgi:hypothetical protein
MATTAESGPAAAAAAPGQGQKAESKRDRKRQIVLDKLAQLEGEFSRDQNMVYRDQLQKISLEMGLGQRFDPYAPDCLGKIAEMRNEHSQAAGATVSPPENGRSLLDMAGPTFSNYLEAIEDATEKRDFALVEHKREHDAKIARYQNEYDHKVQTAVGEHDYLANTIRDRLMNQITSRKNRLNREKEALEISEASALLLHPNQFSITNPASPGGTHGKRATRTRREVEDASGFADKKRKRNADEDGSPGPISRSLDTNHTTLLWQNDKIRMQAKQNGSIFSVEKLFTEKELTLAHNAAAIASHQNILKSRLSPNGSTPSPEGSDSSQDGQDSGDKNAESSSAPMERHATRSTRNVFDEKNMGPETMANFEVPASLRQIYLSEAPKLPSYVSQPYMKPYPRTNDPMTTTSLPAEEIQSDMATFSVFKWYNANSRPGESLDNIRGLKDTLKIAAVPVSEARYQLANSQDVPISALRSTATKNALVNGGVVPLSRQSSVGTPMSRQDSSTRARAKGK